MTSYRDETIAGVERLEMHDFGQNPTVAVESALFDVARFGVAQLCNLGPDIGYEEYRKMFRWAKSNPDIYGKIRSESDNTDSMAFLLDDTFYDLQTNLANSTVSGIDRSATFVRFRRPADRINWHIDASFPFVKSGIRAIFPIGQDHDATLIVSRLPFDGDHDNIQKELSGLPLSSHLRIMYEKRTAILMSEGIGGMKVLASDGNIYGVQSPPHAGLHDIANPKPRILAIADFVLKKSKANNNAFVVPIPSKELRLAS